MRDAARLLTFLAGVVVVFGLAFGVGRAVGPVGGATDQPATVTTSTMLDHAATPGSMTPSTSGAPHTGAHDPAAGTTPASAAGHG